MPLVAIALFTGGAWGQSPSKVLVPPQQIPLRFSHVDHLTKAGLTCSFCHAGVRKSMKTKDRAIPGHAECDECHDRKAAKPLQAKPPAACQTCHVGYSSVRRDTQLTAFLPTAYLKFPHKTHIDKKVKCQTCHGDFVKNKVGLATRAQLPNMSVCLNCHNNRTASSACKTCHLTNKAQMLVTSYPSGILKPSGVLRNDRHDSGWLQSHRGPVGADRGYCGNCHAEQYCQDCHNGAMKPLKYHPGDFISMHPIFAKSAALNCSSCHRDQSFCLSCHQRSGVGFVTGVSRRGLITSPRALVGQRFHPADWVNVGSANFHGIHAQRNIRQCTACHSERTCTDSCHRSTTLVDVRGRLGQGFSPHGPQGSARLEAFKARCRSLFSRNRRMCYKCHLTSVTCDYSPKMQ